MEIQVRSSEDARVEVADTVFDVEYKPALIHQVVTAYLASARSGTVAQKSRSDVSGGGAKPFRQKGTGRARAGTSRGPIWRGGGRAFAARPRNYSQKVNRKMYRGAMCSILSELVRQGRISVVPEFRVEEPKTRILANKLKDMQVSDVLILIQDLDDDLFLAARNLPRVDVLTADEADPVSLIAFENLVITEGAIRKLEERLA
ncbi:MAG: 50S ribosomal protein L4 [Gammaproteobacteria bacterium]|jgi:large subunit ribosomal protein L4|nr:50S ribosomal protein L4 [Gammaproteobacteria bacterium]